MNRSQRAGRKCEKCVRVGCRDEGENAGFSGMQGQPAEFCQEKHRAVFLARAMGLSEVGRGKQTKKKEGVHSRVKKKT